MKKMLSQRFIPQLAMKLAEKPSEMIELFGVSRNYLHKLSTGQRPLTGKLLEKVASFAAKDSGYKAIARRLEGQTCRIACRKKILGEEGGVKCFFAPALTGG